jgi:hypothetical protein
MTGRKLKEAGHSTIGNYIENVSNERIREFIKIIRNLPNCSYYSSGRTNKGYLPMSSIQREGGTPTPETIHITYFSTEQLPTEIVKVTVLRGIPFTSLTAGFPRQSSYCECTYTYLGTNTADTAILMRELVWGPKILAPIPPLPEESSGPRSVATAVKRISSCELYHRSNRHFYGLAQLSPLPMSFTCHWNN